MPTAAPAPLAAPSAPPVKVHEIKGWTRLPAICAGLLVRAWCASLRLRYTENTRRLLADLSRPTLFVLWHNRLFAAAELSRRLRPFRPLHGLVSASKDGAWLAAFFESAGLRVVRGSSSRGGREAAAAMVEVLQAGNDAGLTPDGPRGPVYHCKPGAVVVARRARARVVLVGINYADSRTLDSWDRFALPMPFSTVWLDAEEIDELSLAHENARELFESRLRTLNPDERQDRRAGSFVI